MKSWTEKTVAFTLTVALLGAAGSPVWAEQQDITVCPEPTAELTAAPTAMNYNIVVNDVELSVEAYRQGDRIMVPVRAVGNALGCTVEWHEDRTITLDNGVMHTVLTIGEDQYFVVTSNPDLVGMSAPFALGAAPVLQGNTAYMPVELLGPLYGNAGSVVTVQNGTVHICAPRTSPKPLYGRAAVLSGTL